MGYNNTWPLNYGALEFKDSSIEALIKNKRHSGAILLKKKIIVSSTITNLLVPTCIRIYSTYNIIPSCSY